MTTQRWTRPAAVGAATVLTTAGGIWGASPAAAETPVDRPSSFTSAYTVEATPEGIIDTEGNPAEGEPGATGSFDLMINSDEEVICYDITLRGVTGEYESPAKTATHVHAAPAGQGGPPRIAFPNPEGDGDTRTTSGCLQGPFTTGLDDEATGEDTGAGFSLADIEADPTSFSADTHTADYAAGAVRGQLTPMPVGGVDTGLGGAAQESVSESVSGSASGTGRSQAAAAAGGAAALAAGAAAFVLVRHRRSGGAAS